MVMVWSSAPIYDLTLCPQKCSNFISRKHMILTLICAMMQVLSVSLLDRMTFKELFSNTELTEIAESNANQLGLFDI